ncbi:MAG: 30S ribosomal protein S6--L-glutamate ligase, partial [Gammaproteobacteria bacterium]
MKIAILSRNPKLYSTRRLMEAAKRRRHEVRTLDVLRCYMNITSHRPSIHYKGQHHEEFDAVIPRIG